ncbi:hypothetical protein OBBRIDRAFT_836023 [Obba rivulosa]|uniref:Uncharacterized protein n=1 Tax=Obba rivulosa TaxID=1052685 RepID=A0A8E2DIC5_9APHY|nr:hypothetical protein OBBRIDRAFT_836023 [Obba rivulosa]
MPNASDLAKLPTFIKLARQSGAEEPISEKDFVSVLHSDSALRDITDYQLLVKIYLVNHLSTPRRRLFQGEQDVDVLDDILRRPISLFHCQKCKCSKSSEILYFPATHVNDIYWIISPLRRAETAIQTANQALEVLGLVRPIDTNADLGTAHPR